MRVAIAGGHGQIALLLQELLARAGHQPVGMIRDAEQAADLVAVGGIPLVVDLEATDVDTLATDLDGVDAVVFAAGAGPGSGVARKLTVDRDAAGLLARAAERAGVRRYVMISAIGADGYDPESEDVFQVYLRAKSEADAALRASGLDWTILRPGGLTNDPPTGRVRLAEDTGGGSVPRADVAAVVAAVLADDRSIGRQVELVSGEDPVPEAVARLGRPGD